MKILKLTMVEEFKKGAKMEKKLTLHTNGYQVKSCNFINQILT